jgi:hypothetical protein
MPRSLLMRRLFLLAGLCVASTPGVAAPSPTRVLVRDGDLVPGVPGATFTGFSAPVLNRQAEVLFSASIAGGGATSSNDVVLVLGTPGAWVPVARESDALPGLPPGVFLAPGLQPFENLRLNDAGYLAFAARFTGAGVTTENDTGYVWGRPGSLRVVAREGDPVPGATEGETFDDLGSLSGLKLLLGGADDLGFAAKWRGPTELGLNAGIWLGPATNLVLVARDGRSAPDFPGATFKNLQFASVRLNPAGTLTFTGQTTAFPQDTGLWAGTFHGLRAAWKEGDLLPGTGLALRGFSSATINVQTQVCFVASFSGVATDVDTAILAGPLHHPQIVAREGHPAPGYPAGVVFRSLALVEPILGSGGQVAFTATVEGPGIDTTNGTAVWAGLPGALRIICRRGGAAVDLAEGVVYSTSTGATFALAGLNAHGEAVFKTGVEGPGIGLPNNEGVWGGQPEFLSLLAQREDAVDLGDGEPHHIHLINIVDANGELQSGGGQDGRARSLNDRNQYAMSLVFQAGQGRAIVLIDNVSDTDGNGLTRIFERAHGLPPGADPAPAKLSLRRQDGRLALVFQETADGGPASFALLEAEGLEAAWRAAELTVTNAVDQAGVPDGAVRREALVEGQPEARFFRLDPVVTDPAP